MKGRPRGPSLDIVGCAHSFSCLMRTWKTSQAFRDELISIVSRKLVVVNCPRPQASIDKTNRLIKLLYGDEETKWLQKHTKAGTIKKSPLLEDLEALGSVVDFAHGNLDSMTFWAHGPGLAAALECTSEGVANRAACVEAFVVPLLNWLVNRSWDSSAVSRWT